MLNVDKIRRPATQVSSSFGLEKFNTEWLFFRDDDDILSVGSDMFFARANFVEWESVSLPHTTSIEAKIVDKQWQGSAYYRKQFNAESDWSEKNIFLRFEAAMNVAQVWVNGRHLKTHLGGYLPFTIDITTVLKAPEVNEIVLKLDNRDNSITGPKTLETLDFNTYGGLYRDVFLIVKDKLHITDEMFVDKKAGGGVFVTYPKVSNDLAQINVATHVQNNYGEAKVFRVCQTLSYGQDIVCTTANEETRLAPNQDIELQQLIEVKDPYLWSPQTPNLYDLITTIEIDGQIVDRQSIRIGIRHIHLSKDGLWINGEKSFLRGVNRHQDYPYVGYAIGPNADYRDALKIKQAGFDYVRLSHYPHSTDFMSAADELGLMVVDAILGWQYFNDCDDFREHNYQSCRDLIRRDRNHPCVLAWEASINETDMPTDFIDKMHQIVHEEYPGDQAFSAGWVPDGYDIYLQSRQDKLGRGYEEPSKPYIVSEYGDWEYYANNEGFAQDDWSNILDEGKNSRQLLRHGERRLLQQVANLKEAHNDNLSTPAIADGYWVMFDYNRGYADDLEASGLMSIERLPKFSYYFFKSQRSPKCVADRFSSGPMVKIASWWTKDSSLDVTVFANTDSVELFLNGCSLGMQYLDDIRNSSNLQYPPYLFAIDAFEAGSLVAIGYIDGVRVTEQSVTTPGEIAALTLEIDISGREPEVGVNDMVFIYAKIVDRNKTVVPINDIEMKFSVSSGLKLISPNVVRTEAGIAAALVRIGELESVLKVTVDSQDLPTAKLHIDCESH